MVMATNRNKFRAAAGKALAVVSVILIVVLILASNSTAATKYKTLHTFKAKGAHSPGGSLIFDSAGNLYGTAGLGGSNRTVATSLPVAQCSN
jgi:hypothetical protein